MNFIHTYISPLGKITLASDGEALTGLWFDAQKYYAAGLAQNARPAELPVFDETSRWLDVYFAGQEPDFTPPLHLKGTAFREMVWEVLLTIPYGQTMTYGEIAHIVAWKLGKQHMSAQAVGGAVGHNPISIIVPCHRVLGTDGSLTGYAGGVDIKQALLNLEQTL